MVWVRMSGADALLKPAAYAVLNVRHSIVILEDEQCIQKGRKQQSP